MLKSVTWRGDIQTNTLRRCPSLGPCFEISTLDVQSGRFGDNNHIPNLLLWHLQVFIQVNESELHLLTSAISLCPMFGYRENKAFTKTITGNCWCRGGHYENSFYDALSV